MSNSLDNIQDISEDQIYDKLMLVLIANEGTVFDQYKLYSKLIDKLNLTTVGIPANFKCKYMVVLRQLMSKSDNVKLTKDNNVYHVVYGETITSKINSVNFTPTWLNRSDFNEYVITNKLKDQISYCDPDTGNTILHEVLEDNNLECVKKLINDYNIDYTIKNKLNKSPIECIKDINMATLIISDLNSRIINIENNLNLKINQLENKTKQLENRINELETRNFIEECAISDFLNVKFKIFLKNNWLIISMVLFFAFFIQKYFKK